MDDHLASLFVTQVEAQCRYADLAVRDLEQALLATGRPESRVRVWYSLQAFLTASANLSKALWGRSDKAERDRASLRTRLGIRDDSPLRGVRVRNHHEHLDERLDQWWATSVGHNYVDFAIGPVRQVVIGLEPTEIFRQFDPETGELIFWDDTFNVAEIMAEIARIWPTVDALQRTPYWKWPPFSNDEGGGQ